MLQQITSRTDGRVVMARDSRCPWHLLKLSFSSILVGKPAGVRIPLCSNSETGCKQPENFLEFSQAFCFEKIYFKRFLCGRFPDLLLVPPMPDVPIGYVGPFAGRTQQNHFLLDSTF
jgi:hypothetical protein